MQENHHDDETPINVETVYDETPKKIDATDEDLSFKQEYEKASEAVAISYDAKKRSPFISALGNDERAEAIVEMAKELGLYVHKDPALLNQLKGLKEGEEIPKELYTIIAIIMSFSYYLQGKTPEVYKRQDGSTAVNTNA